MKKTIIAILILSMVITPFNFLNSIEVMAADDYSRCESFEGTSIPQKWSVINGGAIQLSQHHYKHGTNSLLWNWTSGSKIRVDAPLYLEEAGTYAKGGMKAWIYNDTPMNETITFKFGTQGQLDNDNAHYQFDININFEGWRAIWIKFQQEGANPNYTDAADEALEMMEIIAPSQAGSIYFDIIEFVNEMPISRSADYQMPKIGVADIESASYWDKAYYYSQLAPSLPPETTITQQQIDDFNTIENKYEKWIYGQNLDLTKEPLNIRNTALQQFINEGLTAYNNLNIVKHADGRITGKPLFSSRDPHLIKFGVDVSRAVLLPLVYDYKINGNASSKDKFFNALDYMYDQGWAEGSGLGTMDHESNKHCGYFHAIYLMKNELQQTGRLAREMGTFRWQTIFNKTFETDFGEVTADEIRTKFMYNLLYVLLMDDTPEKVRYMKGLLNYYNAALLFAPGYADTIKPDYSQYHHRGPYLSAYGPSAIHMAALVAYLVSDTSFTLSQQSMDNIKNTLLHMRIYANKYNTPLGVSGRLPDLSGVLANCVPAYAYMAYATNPIDTEMASAFMRLWEPNSTYLKDKVFPIVGSYSVYYLHTMGGLQLAVDLAEAGYQAESSPNGTWAYPYSSLVINRQNDWMVSVKGYGQYVWDYEAANKFDPQTLTTLKENVFGRYQSYGSIQINSSGSPVGTMESGYNIENGWDWNRWPGSTTKHLALSNLMFNGDRGYHRLFSDQTFVGGVTSQNQYGMFGMKLHDLHFDPSLRANKTVFMFGDKMICLGSDIENTDTVNRTETTLFQSYMSQNTMPFWFNSTQAITNATYSTQITSNQSAWIIDPYNNGYYLPNANGLKIQRGIQTSRDSKDSQDTSGNYTTAWLDHGTSPTGKGYEYAIKVATTPQDMQAFANNPQYVVLQKNSDAHIVQNTDLGLSITGYAVMNETSTIQHGYLQNASVPCMVMIRDIAQDEIVLSMSDPDLRLPKFSRHKDITDSAIMAESTMNTTVLTLKGAWKLKNPSNEARIISVDNTTTKIAFDCVDGKNLEIELLKDALTLEADTYIRDGNYSNDNYGTNTTLAINGSSTIGENRETYVKYNLTGVDTNAVTAKLKLYANQVNGSVPLTIYSVPDDSWTENALTWNSKPTGGTALGTVTVDTANKWYSIDITSFVNGELAGDKVASLCIVDNTAANTIINFDSKENINVPKLEISFEAQPVPEPATLNPIADSYVRGGSYADTNYGTIALRIKGTSNPEYTRESYLKFDLNNLSPNAQSAQLKLYTTSVGGAVPVTIYSVTDDSWTEAGLTWNNKPAGVTALGTVTIDTANTWVTFDITSFVNNELAGDKVVSLYIKDNTTSGIVAVFDSKEDANSPQLNITY